jgi:hypothetical protein
MKKIKIIKLIALLSILISCRKIYSQNAPFDANFVFKTMMILDFNDFSIEFNSNVFSEYLKSFEIYPDTLIGSYPGENNFLILRVELDNPSRMKVAKKNEITECFFLKGTAREYILAINRRSSKVYRISGFSSCDFADLLSDMEYRKKQLMNRYFLRYKLKREFRIQSVDIGCLFDAIGKPYNPEKYPCTRRVTEAEIIVINW